ncbi:TRAP transporter large permease [Moorella sulfitireducens]|uniref:TRAP transporter large permease n=1 Tax=Neomoorella sulfitireducens TaxID=2972948 RepID=UPI0021ABBD1F|nr:TRAP transporter large permease [Moorella sulfitireducens]
MAPELIGIIGIAVLLVCLASGLWIGFSMALVGFFGIIALRGVTQALNVVGSVPFSTINSYNMTVVPMFLLMGLVISETNIGVGLYRAANSWLGSFRGGLATATTMASGLLGAICSSHMTGTIIMSKIALPEMRKYKYDDGLACGSIAGAAPLSIIIPPSMPFIMYGIITEQSVGKLFMAGVIPGIILMLTYVIIISFVTRRNPKLGPAGEKTSMKEKFSAILDILPMLLLFGLVFGGIYGGFFTTTESGAIGALGAIVIAFASRQLTFKKLRKCIVDTAIITSTILVLLTGTYIFISFITLSKFPFLMASQVQGLNAPDLVIIAAIAGIYIILGMFLPDMPMIVLTIPILYPIITALGFDPIWFGMFVVLMQAVGSVSPPVGMVVYLLSGLSKVQINTIFKGVLPFIVGMVFVIILVVLFPPLSTFLPSLMK